MKVWRLFCLGQIFPFFVILFFLVIVQGCIKKKAEWKGTIEEEDGVTVVKNPREPIYGEDVFSLEEELSIGESEGREEYMFSLISSIAVDDKENIYVLDAKERHVRVFSRNGNYVRTIGRRGQGPGELENPHTVIYTSQNEIVVFDPKKRSLVYFSLEGKFIKNLSIANLFNPPEIDSAGNIIGFVIIRDKENPRYELQKFDPQLNYLHSLDSSPKPDSSPEGFNPFRQVLEWDITKDDQIICGYPENYELRLFDTKGKLMRKIIKEYVPHEITKEEISRSTKRAPSRVKFSIPKYHTAFRWLVDDDEGRIFVCTWEKTEDRKSIYYDVFDPEGIYIAKIPLRHVPLLRQPLVFKKNNLYCVREDEEGYQMVKRYKVMWRWKK